MKNLVLNLSLLLTTLMLTQSSFAQNTDILKHIAELQPLKSTIKKCGKFQWEQDNTGHMVLCLVQMNEDHWIVYNLFYEAKTQKLLQSERWTIPFAQLEKAAWGVKVADETSEVLGTAHHPLMLVGNADQPFECEIIRASEEGIVNLPQAFCTLYFDNKDNADKAAEKIRTEAGVATE